MFTILGLEYAALAFTTVIGILQIVAAFNNLRGMLFFRYRLTGYIFGGLAITVPMYFFFTWDYRFPIGKIQGSEQTGLFFFATIAAIIFTLLVSSLTNIGRFTQTATPQKGLDALREGAFIQTFRERIARKR